MSIVRIPLGPFKLLSIVKVTTYSFGRTPGIMSCNSPVTGCILAPAYFHARDDWTVPAKATSDAAIIFAKSILLECWSEPSRYSDSASVSLVRRSHPAWSVQASRTRQDVHRQHLADVVLDKILCRKLIEFRPWFNDIPFRVEKKRCAIESLPQSIDPKCDIWVLRVPHPVCVSPPPRPNAISGPCSRSRLPCVESLIPI